MKELKDNKAMKELKDYINEALNEAIAIPRKFNTSFTYDDLGLEAEEAEFLKKYLKTDDVYQLPEFDDNGRNVKQFDKMYDLFNKSKELETFVFNYSTYTAYELPKGTVVVYMDDPGYNGSCFYLSSNKINE